MNDEMATITFLFCAHWSTHRRIAWISKISKIKFETDIDIELHNWSDLATIACYCQRRSVAFDYAYLHKIIILAWQASTRPQSIGRYTHTTNKHYTAASYLIQRKIVERERKKIRETHWWKRNEEITRNDCLVYQMSELEQGKMSKWMLYAAQRHEWRR